MLTFAKRDVIIVSTNCLKEGKKMRCYLKELRKNKKITQQNVAKQLKISPQYYSLIEKGERKEKLDVVTLCGLAQVFDVPLSVLVEKEKTYLEKA